MWKKVSLASIPEPKFQGGLWGKRVGEEQLVTGMFNYSYDQTWSDLKKFWLAKVTFDCQNVKLSSWDVLLNSGVMSFFWNTGGIFN